MLMVVTDNSIHVAPSMYEAAKLAEALQGHVERI